MPLPILTDWPRAKAALYDIGLVRVNTFCDVNGLPRPVVRNVPPEKWRVNACAYYRPEEWKPISVELPMLDDDEDVPVRVGLRGGINICLRDCGSPAPEATCANWTWPASVTDREPCGVLAHELGHHADWCTGDNKGKYWSDYCDFVLKKSREAPLTSYAATNPAEYLAEAFRLWVLNPDLLRLVRPRTHAVLAEKWTPIETRPWLRPLGTNVPVRVVKALRNKGAR